MNISGFGDSSVLNDLYASGKLGSSKVANGSSSDGGLTISQIRDQVDKLATTGQLTDAQQRALVGAGFQDLNANDPTYQPAGQEGYTRLTTQTFDFSSTLQSIASFDSAHGNSTVAATYNSLADLFKQDEAISSFSFSQHDSPNDLNVTS